MRCPGNSIGLPQFSARSCHRGFILSMSAIFFSRRHRLICFSRAMALRTSSDFVVNQTDALVGFRESFNLECFVLKDPCVQMTCDAGVQRASEAGHDVNPIPVLSLQAHEGTHHTRPDGVDRKSVVRTSCVCMVEDASSGSLDSAPIF